MYAAEAMQFDTRIGLFHSRNSISNSAGKQKGYDVRKVVAALIIFGVALSGAVHVADAATKKILKKFQFEQGSITFYVDRSWTNVRNGKRS